MKKEKYIIVAVDGNYGIGKDGDMPWHLKGEMQYFKKRTTETHDEYKKNAVIMGRTTWESIPEKNRPLSGRLNIVLTHDPNYTAEDATVCDSIEKAYLIAEEDGSIEKIFIIGGAKVFEQTLQDMDGIYITQIKRDYDCDTFFPEIPSYFEEVKQLGSGEEGGVEYDFLLYRNI